MFITDDYDKEDVLLILGEELIFSLVFGYLPVEGENVLSPFREDKNPGCYFKTYNDRLWFIDFGNMQVNNGIKLWCMDCFSAVKYYFQLPTFNDTLVFIKERLIYGKDYKKSKVVESKAIVKKSEDLKTKIYIDARDFDFRDELYWITYSITESQLKEDKVFPIQSFKISSKKGTTSIDCHSISYAYTNFKKNRKKLYFPQGKKRFITNCIADDIGEFEELPFAGDNLIFTKSYKDCRVIRNLGYLAVWNQNEGIVPSEKILAELCHRFASIAIFYDNDRTGIRSSKILLEKFNNSKVKIISIPDYKNQIKIKDAADLVRYKGESELRKFLKEKIDDTQGMGLY